VFRHINRAGEELLGYDRKALLGKSDLNLFPPEQAAHFMVKDREFLDGEPASWTSRKTHPDGQERPAAAAHQEGLH